MTTGATMFSGGGVAEALLKNHIDIRWAIEYDPAIAAVYRQNIGDHIIVGDVRHQGYGALGSVDWLHASPVCTRASVANSGATESEEDIEMAQAVVRALEAVQPRAFTLENVWKYREFVSFRRICQALDRLGYWYSYEHLNAADYGVPQTRRRLILRATRDRLLPTLPEPTPWRGWYAAIEDLIPTLPETQFAPWQLARLPAEMRESAEPAVTHQHGGRLRALVPILMGDDNTGQERGKGYRVGAEPAPTQSTERSFRAWLSTGRVVKMTPRCLARFQSMPDSYELPEKASLATHIIGNGWPSEMALRVVEQLI